MGTANVLSMMLFQGDAATIDHSNLLVWSVVVIAICSFVQLVMFLGAAIGALKAYKSVSLEIGALKAKAMPLVASVQGVVDDARPVVKNVSEKVQEIIQDAQPKVKVATANVVDISNMAKAKIQELEATLDQANQTIRSANEKTRAQVDQVDRMVSSTLKATSDLGNTIHRGIRLPVLEVAGVVNGLKAALDTLTGRSKAPGSDARGTYAPPVSRPYQVPRSSNTAAGPSFSGDPSSNVAPSPGADEVVERFRRETSKTII